MIFIHQPILEEKDNKCYINTFIDVDSESKKVWFSVDKKYGKYLCYERSDAFVIGLLPFAMRNGHDIKCETPLTESLYYQLETYFIPALAYNSKSLYHTKLDSPVGDSSELKNEHAVGTGISGGIDSLSTIITHLDTKFPAHNITHLMFNNVGSHGGGEKGKELYHIRLNRIREYCQKYGFKLIETDSNFHEEFPQNHLLTHTYANMFAVYMLQKLFGIYYYSSDGYKFSNIKLGNNEIYDCAKYEMFSLYMLSTEHLKLYSSCSTLSRLEKTEIVSKYSPSYEYLDVCGLHPYSCMKCSKCIRTMFALHILGELKNYKKIFDVDYFYDHYKYYLSLFYAYYKAHKSFFDELYPYIKNEITVLVKLKAIWIYRKFILDKIFKNGI